MKKKSMMMCFAFILQLVIVTYLFNFRPTQHQYKNATCFDRFIQPPLSPADHNISVSTKPDQTARANVTFLLEPTNEGKFSCRGKCATNEEIRWRMVFFVKSAFENIEKRKKIRETWGAIRQVNGTSLKAIFVIGMSNFSNMKLEEESSIHGDILQYRGPDNYSNIAKKTLAGMQWAVENLPELHLFSSVDDDIFVDIKALVDNIDNQFTKLKNNNWPEFPIFCGFIKGVNERVVRKGEKAFQKWAISKEMYRWPTFPPYCHGGLYVTSVSVIKQLYNLSRYKELWYLDDVWLTGLLRRELGMPDEMVTDDKCPAGYHVSSNPGDNWKWNACKKKAKKDLVQLLDDASFCKCSYVVTS